ncbi:hypothetical protein VNO78_32007 [Psophocarpus tetragonolobus]|uniref:Uncharacterized protein n=1 Tax=Psophocarpus tetragonolobus TaxID=3891 RepID=A0AAN9RYV9_PSOTE
MGINFSFCCSEAYLRRQRLPKEDSSCGNISLVVWFVKNIKQTYLLRKKRMQKLNKEGKQQQQQKMGKELTLEEWLLKSPIMEKDGNCNGDHCGFKHHSESDYPSVARQRTNFSDCGEYNLSLEQLLNGADCTAWSMDYSITSENLSKDENIEVKEVEFNSLTKSESSKVKKRVSFRLPEVSDTIILYSQETDFKEC